jgi:hypothetical protein
MNNNKNRKLYDDYCTICGAPVRLYVDGARCGECGLVFCENHFDSSIGSGCEAHEGALT